jgi:hypothetical protein
MESGREKTYVLKTRPKLPRTTQRLGQPHTGERCGKVIE